MRRLTIRNTAVLGLAVPIMFFCVSCQGFEDQLIYNQASRAHDKRDFDRAIQLYRQLLDKDPQDKTPPDNAIVHYDLGVAYLDRGDQQKAEGQIQELKKMKRDDLAKQLNKLIFLSDTL